MTDSEATYLLQYTYVEDVLEKRAPYRESHIARIQAAKEAGNVFVAGAFGDPPVGGALGFKGLSKSEIEDWSDQDPYWVGGLVVERSIQPWKLV
jgi:uncharacterized protein YciI